MSSRPGTSQRDLERVHSGQVPTEAWVRRMSDGDRHRPEGLYWEWRRTHDGGPFSVGVECAVLRDNGSQAGCERCSNARPDLGVSETNLAKMNAVARVGEVMWVIRRGDWVDGRQTTAFNRNDFYNSSSRNEARSMHHAPAVASHVIYRMVSRAPLRAAEGYSRR